MVIFYKDVGRGVCGGMVGIYWMKARGRYNLMVGVGVAGCRGFFNSKREWYEGEFCLRYCGDRVR